MTIPKKGSRPIEVNGKHYRWMVKALSGDRLTLTIEEQGTGEIYQRNFYRGGERGRETIGPGDVREEIERRFLGASPSEK